MGARRVPHSYVIPSKAKDLLSDFGCSILPVLGRVGPLLVAGPTLRKKREGWGTPKNRIEEKAGSLSLND
jgi:hypothetical protein